MSTSSICSSCLRTLHRQTRRQIAHQKPSTAYSPKRAFTASTRTSDREPARPSTSTTNPDTPSTQSSLLATLRNTPALRSTTEPYVAYGATETLFVSCAKTCSYTIPQANEKPPQPAPKNAAGEDVGVGEGWWFAPKDAATNPGLELPVTFNTWAQVMYLHMYALTVRLRKFPAADVRIWEQNLLDHFFYAAEDRMAMWHGMAARGIRNKYLKELWVQWRGVLLSYDEGLIKGDAVLAGAIWRNVFQAREDVDLGDLAAVVAYLRREIKMLDELEDHAVAAGNVRFALKRDEGRTLGARSPWMDKTFTQEDLAALKEGRGNA